VELSRLAAVALAAGLACGPAACATGTAGGNMPAQAPATSSPAPVAPPVNQTRAACPPAGDTQPRSLPGHSTAELYLVVVEQDGCADRAVFRVNGAGRFGGHARYVDVVRAGRSGDLVPVSGAAAIEIVVNTPAFGHAGSASGHQPGRTPWRVGQEVVQVPAGWPSLRQVRYAGANDFSESVIAVGVQERRAFSMFWRAGDGYSELVIEIAHG